MRPLLLLIIAYWVPVTCAISKTWDSLSGSGGAAGDLDAGAVNTSALPSDIGNAGAMWYVLCCMEVCGRDM